MFAMEISHCFEQLVNYKARMGFQKVSSFLFDVGDEVSTCNKIFDYIADRSAVWRSY